MSKGKLTVMCDKCDHKMKLTLGEKISKRISKPEKPSMDNSILDLPEDINSKLVGLNAFPMAVTIADLGFWTTDNNGIHKPNADVSVKSNSVMFSSDCELYVCKLALRHFLLSKKIIPPFIDPGNLVSHMVVRSDRNRGFADYSAMKGKTVTVTTSMLTAKNDFLMVELNRNTTPDLHTTLIFSKGIGKKVDLIAAFETVVKILRAYPILIEQYKSLPYFGQSAIKYWHDTGDLYPFNVIQPESYQETNEEAEIKAEYFLK